MIKKVLISFFFLCFVLYFLPASLLNLVFYEKKLPVRLQYSTGTIWSGEGQFFFLPPAGQKNAHPIRLLDTVRWHVGLGEIFSRGISVHLDSQSFSLPAIIYWSRHQTVVSPFRLFFDASVLNYFGDPFHSLSLDGLVSLQSQGLTVNSSGVSGNLRADLHLVSSSLVPSVNVLGDYTVDCRGHGSNVSLEISTNQGALLVVEGQGHLDLLQRKGAFQGVVRTEKEAPNSVEQFLRFMGRRRGADTLLSGDFSW